MVSATLYEPSSAQSAPTRELTKQDFKFLKRLNPLLADYTERAAEFASEHPEDCLGNLRRFAEYVVVYLESATNSGVSNNGGEETAEAQGQKFGDRLRSLTAGGYLPEEIRQHIAYIWFNGAQYGAHAPKIFFVTKDQIAAHKNQVKVYVPPFLDAALIIANWLEKECKNQQGWIAWILRRPIGLKNQLQKVQ
jgi:hypothetical protein